MIFLWRKRYIGGKRYPNANVNIIEGMNKRSIRKKS
jgi:hypothetical protein